MAEVAAPLLKHRERLSEIADVLARYGLGAWAARGSGLAGVPAVASLLSRAVTPEERDASDGERLRGALTELGTTYIKFGQMLSHCWGTPVGTPDQPFSGRRGWWFGCGDPHAGPG